MTALVPVSRQPKAPLLDGMARLIDICGVQCRRKQFDSGVEADLYSLQKDWGALLGDWAVIQNDLSVASSRFVEEMEGIKARLLEGSDQ